MKLIYKGTPTNCPDLGKLINGNVVEVGDELAKILLKRGNFVKETARVERAEKVEKVVVEDKKKKEDKSWD
jgi:hypothetical protein